MIKFAGLHHPILIAYIHHQTYPPVKKRALTEHPKRVVKITGILINGIKIATLSILHSVTFLNLTSMPEFSI